jgi:hypothetical protein
MSNDTRQAPDPAPLPSYAAREGVFIPRKQVRKMRRARDLLDDAQRRARDLIRAAEEKAGAVQRQAYVAGYDDGALAAAAHVLAHFGAVQDLTQRMREQMEQHARDLLSQALDHPEAVLALLEQCLQGLAGPPGQPVVIRLPQALRGMRMRLNALIEQTGQRAVEIDYHDDARLIVLHGEQVFEFDPPALIEQGQRRLSSRQRDLVHDCRQLSDDAAQRWRDAFEQRFIAQDGEDDADDADGEALT